MTESNATSNAVTSANEREIVITRVFDAPRELVWKAWTEPERIMRWFGPKGFTTPVCKVDLRPGGVMHFCMRSPDGKDYWNGGVFREVVPPSRLVYTDYFADENGNPVSPAQYGMSPDFPAENLITVTFEEFDGKTKLTLHHTIPASVAEQAGAQQGWNETLDKFAEYLAKQ